MKVRLLAFASVVDAVGAAESDVELPAGAGTAELRRELLRRHPTLKPLWSRIAVAIDGEIVRGDAPLHDGAEIALLPPVSGG